MAVRVVECAELIAADLFRNADENRHRITFGDVERHLAELANHPRGCSCGRCPLVSRVSAQRVYAIASGSGSRRACVFRTLVACRRPLRRLATSALLIIDTQVDFVDGGRSPIAGTTAVIPKLVELRSAFLDAGRPVIHVVRLYAGEDVDRVRRTAMASREYCRSRFRRIADRAGAIRRRSANAGSRPASSG